MPHKNILLAFYNKEEYNKNRTEKCLYSEQKIFGGQL